MNDLRDRITAAVMQSLLDQSKGRYANRWTPVDDDGNDLPEQISLDASVDPALVADAIIRTCRDAWRCTSRDGCIQCDWPDQ